MSLYSLHFHELYFPGKRVTFVFVLTYFRFSRDNPGCMTVHVTIHVPATRDRSRGFAERLPLALFSVYQTNGRFIKQPLYKNKHFRCPNNNNYSEQLNIIIRSY